MAAETDGTFDGPVSLLDISASAGLAGVVSQIADEQ